MEEKQESRLRRSLLWIGHHALKFYMVFLAVYAVAWVWSSVEVLQGIKVLVAMPIVPAIVVKLMYHDRNLCQKCFNRSPFGNPEKALKKYKPLLKLAHSKGVVISVSGVIGVIVGAYMLAFDRQNKVLEMIALAFITIGLVVENYIDGIHSRLMVWCPKCTAPKK